jgi:hypothetical protein
MNVWLGFILCRYVTVCNLKAPLLRGSLHFPGGQFVKQTCISELCHQLAAAETFAGKPKQNRIDQPDHQSYDQDNTKTEVHHA